MGAGHHAHGTDGQPATRGAIRADIEAKRRKVKLARPIGLPYGNAHAYRPK
jgi:hypothetical protein